MLQVARTTPGVLVPNSTEREVCGEHSLRDVSGYLLDLELPLVPHVVVGLLCLKFLNGRETAFGFCELF
jgi:hypothetical protein